MAVASAAVAIIGDLNAAVGSVQTQINGISITLGQMQKDIQNGGQKIVDNMELKRRNFQNYTIDCETICKLMSRARAKRSTK